MRSTFSWPSTIPKAWAGKRSTIEIVVDEVDPVAENYATILGSTLANAVNQHIIQRAVEEGQGYALQAGEAAASAIPADVVSAPTEARLVNLSPQAPTVTSFFGPAVLALILQHLAVSLVAMSLVRERSSGVMELFRISPVTAAEVLAGKVLAYGLLGFVVAGLTMVLLVNFLGVPSFADTGTLALVVGLLLLASLGLGLFIAVVSDSERQAVQLSLLTLLASVFFSGFVLSIDQFTPPVRALAYALPVTHGIQLLQDLMLRGTTTHLWQAGALVVIAAVTLSQRGSCCVGTCARPDPDPISAASAGTVLQRPPLRWFAAPPVRPATVDGSERAQGGSR